MKDFKRLTQGKSLYICVYFLNGHLVSFNKAVLDIQFNFRYHDNYKVTYCREKLVPYSINILVYRNACGMILLVVRTPA